MIQVFVKKAYASHTPQFSFMCAPTQDSGGILAVEPNPSGLAYLSDVGAPIYEGSRGKQPLPMPIPSHPPQLYKTIDGYVSKEFKKKGSTCHMEIENVNKSNTNQ